MTLNIATLRLELREHLGVDTTEYTDPDCDNLLNRSFWEIADKFDFREKEGSTTFSTVAGTSVYATQIGMESFSYLSIEDLNTQLHTKLEPITLEVYEDTLVNNSKAYAKPTGYFRYSNKITLYPTPDQVYTLTEYYNLTLADIAPNGIVVPQVWTDPILFGAIWRGFSRIGDYNRSNMAAQNQQRLIQGIKPVKSKEEVDRRFAGVSVPRRPI